MEDIPVRISELDPAYQAQDTDELEVNQQGTTRKVLLRQVRTLVGSMSPFRPPSAGYQASAFDCLVVDTTPGVVTINLSPTPNDLDVVTFKPPNDSWGSPNLLIVNPQGQPINGIVDTLACDIPVPFQLCFYAPTGWRVEPLRGPPGEQGIQGIQGEAMYSPSNTPTFVADHYTMTESDIGKTFVITTGSGADQTITLFDPASGAFDGRAVAFYKNDTGTAVLIIKNPDGTTDNTHLMQVGDFIRLRVSGTAWTANDTRIQDMTRILDGTVVGTYNWIKRPRLTRVRLYGIGGGGGGGSGRRFAAGNARSGGGGGSVGNLIDRTFPASTFPASLSFTIGATAPGGPAVTTDDTNGNAGTAGTEVIATNYFRARGGSGGQGGIATAAGGSVSQAASDRTPVNNGGAGSITANSTPPSNNGGPGCGGAGGGISTGNVAFNGASGGIGSLSAVVSPAAGTGGAAPGVNGGNAGGAFYPSSRPDIECGSGGGGGGANTAGAGGNGGDGGFPGGAGGGGGASQNGFNSGAGGMGHACRLIITEIYAR